MKFLTGLKERSREKNVFMVEEVFPTYLCQKSFNSSIQKNKIITSKTNFLQGRSITRWKITWNVMVTQFFRK